MMTKSKQFMLAAATALALSSPAISAPINAGGVMLDPNYSDGGDVDFISQFNFTQWYTLGNGGEGSATLGYENAASIGNVIAATLGGGSSGTGFFLQGVGEFYRVNELDLTNGDPTLVTGGGELTFAFGGIELNKDLSFNISGAFAKVYVDQGPTTNYTNPASDPAEIASARDGAVWLDLQFVSLSFEDGGVADGQVSAKFNILGGAGASYFVPGTLTYTANAFFTNSLAHQYSTGGNGSAQGNTENRVPEPGSIALIGMGLLGLMAATRRKA